MARCPKCHCGELVEIGRRMVCLNCDYTCSRAHARLLQNDDHIHQKVTFSGAIDARRGLTARPNTAPRAVPPTVRTTRTNQNVNPRAANTKQRIIPAIIFLIIMIMAVVSFGLMDSCAAAAGNYPPMR